MMLNKPLGDGECPGRGEGGGGRRGGREGKSLSVGVPLTLWNPDPV